MSEQLLPGTFDKLAETTWDIARLNMAEALQIAPPHSVVRGSVDIDDVVLGTGSVVNITVETGVYVTSPEDILDEKLPEALSLAINEREPYGEHAGWTQYSYGQIEMDTHRGTLEFSRGVEICSEDGNTITPEDHKPLPCELDDHYRLAPKAAKVWKEMITKSGDAFSDEEGRRYLRIARLAVATLTQND